jgi:hypothetical protein
MALADKNVGETPPIPPPAEFWYQYQQQTQHILSAMPEDIQERVRVVIV